MYQSYYQSYFNSYHPNTSPPAAASSATAENLALNSSGIAGNSGPSPPATVLDLREAAASPHSPSASSSTKSVRLSKLFLKLILFWLARFVWKVFEIFERNLDHLRRGEICLAFQRPFNLPFTRVLSWKIAAQECLVSLRQSNDRHNIVKANDKKTLMRKMLSKKIYGIFLRIWQWTC